MVKRVILIKKQQRINYFTLAKSSFDLEISKIYDRLFELVIPETPSPEEMTAYQRDLDILRTKITLEMGIVQAKSDEYKKLYKTIFDITYQKAKKQLYKKAVEEKGDKAKEPTDASIKSLTTSVMKKKEIELNEDSQVEEELFNVTLYEFCNILEYKLCILKSIIDVLQGKQTATYTPNNQLAIEAQMSK